MPRYDAVLFDVDGTLIHSRPGIENSFAYAFAQMGLDPAQIDVSRYLGPPLRRTFAEHFRDPEDVEKAVTLYRALYKERGQYACRLFPGVEEMLHRLHEAGLQLCTATSKPAEVARPILQHLGIDRWFTMIGGAAMDSPNWVSQVRLRRIFMNGCIHPPPAQMIHNTILYYN